MMISIARPQHTPQTATSTSTSTSTSAPRAAPSSTSRQPRQFQQSLDRLHQDDYSAASFASNLLDDDDDAFTSALAIADYQAFDPMQSDTWGPIAQYTPNLGRLHHQRESSLSSLGSAGPASPFNHNTSNPQIAVTDSADGLPDMNTHDASANPGASYYQLAKSMGTYPGYQNLDSSMPEMAYPITIPGPGSKPRVDRGLLPAPDFANGGATRSHPASVASSIAGDSPATPTTHDSEAVDRRSKGYGNVPKLDRTMTDIYGDELYNPNFAITSSSPSQPHLAMSPHNDVFSQRINAANNQHLSANSPTSSTSRDRSPFRTGSPMAPSPSHDFVTSHSTMSFNSAQRAREQARAQQEAHVFRQMAPGGQQPETPKTISPKDAILEFNEPDGETNFPLFPQDPSTNFEMDQLAKVMMPHGNMAGQNGAGGQMNYMPSQLPGGIQLPQQYPFIARNQPGHDTPPRLSSAGSSSVESSGNAPSSRPRPMGTAADGGTYTCTYHGCTLRFETPSLLQKHKREGHRQTQGIGGPRVQEISMSASLLNSQAGPHRCDRINPSTGKPCSTIFSRPYDLTRHEDTIHNARKQKVRCGMCTEEKTFSRADALTRHYRVCHPDVEVPGKHRRRAV
jgi:hypothetical protein